jgi:hypothetical protein
MGSMDDPVVGHRMGSMDDPVVGQRPWSATWPLVSMWSDNLELYWGRSISLGLFGGLSKVSRDTSPAIPCGNLFSDACIHRD